MVVFIVVQMPEAEVLPLWSLEKVLPSLLINKLSSCFLNF